MNPLTQRLLMSAAGKAAIPGAWTLGSTNRTDDPIVSVGLLSGKLAFGFNSGSVSVLNNDGTWANADIADFTGSPVFAVDSVTQDNGQAYHVTGGRASVTTRTVGGGVQGQQFSTGIWGSNSYRVISMRLVRNGAWIVGGENGALAQSLYYGNTGSWSQVTVPGASSLGSLGNISEIIYKETPAYSGDTTGWWAFFVGGGYIHNVGTSYNGISNGNPNLFSGSTLRTDLRSLFKNGEVIANVTLILNQFVVLTNYGRIFLSYTGFNWELRTDLGSGDFINYEFFSALFDGQNYVVIANSPGNVKNLAVFTNKLDNITDIDDFKNFTTEPLLQNISATNIFFHNNRYYITLADGRYFYKDVTVTPVTKPVIQPMQLTLTPTTTFNIYIDYFWDAGSKFELADVVVVNEEGQSVRESVNGINANCTRIAYSIPSDVFFYGSFKTLRKLSIPSGASGKVKVFGRRYGFQTVQQFLNIPEYNTTPVQLSYITSIDNWGNATFLTLEGAFANNRNLVNITNEVMPPFSRCHSMAGMFANCTSLNQFPKIPSALGAIITVSGMLYNCREFNQPIVNESGGILNTYRLADASHFLSGASKWNNTLKLVLNGTGSPVSSYTKSLSSMFFGCSALTGTFDNSITNLELITDSQYQIRCVGMFENCTSFNANLVPAGNYWNTSRVTSMTRMFSGCSVFNGNITTWDVSNVLYMGEMFKSASLFNQNISNWNTSKVTLMFGMFNNAKKFNQSINYNSITGTWNTANVVNMSNMFNGAEEFNGNISNWNTGKVTNMSAMFYKTYVFNQSISNWNTENVTDMSYMFSGSGFNSYLNSWNTGKVANMIEMFAGTKSFSGLLSNWNVSNVVSMAGMFQFSNWFGDPNLGNWNTANVVNMSNMFDGAANFNSPINNWNVSKVTTMRRMFGGAEKFNQNLNSWITSNVTDMSYMFFNAYEFNGNIGSWDVSKVTDMSYMFTSARKFNSNISLWNVSKVATMEYMFRSALEFNQPIGSWGTKTSLVTRMGSMFSDAAKFDQNIESWNVSSVIDTNQMFAGAVKFNQPLAGWNMAKVRDTSYMFSNAWAFNQPIDGWTTSSVINMSNMFNGATAFNQPLSSWNTTKVINMFGMFQNATSFDQLISTWNTSQVISMDSMFEGATAFSNGQILFDRHFSVNLNRVVGWDTSKVTSMNRMFYQSNFDKKYYWYTIDEALDAGNSNPNINRINDYIFPRQQSIKNWCVSLISTPPTNFGFTTNAPVWGTCPTPPTYRTLIGTFTSNQKELDLRSWAVNSGWDQISPVSVIIDSNVYVWSDDTTKPALRIEGSFPTGVCVINKGFIIGRGGDGGNGDTAVLFIKGKDAGPAIKTTVNNFSLSNRSFICGGGGGGSAAGLCGGGGGAGGGNGGATNASILGSPGIPGGAGGVLGGAGQNGPVYNSVGVGFFGAGGGGGRVVPGPTSGTAAPTYAQMLLQFPNIGGFGSQAGGSGGSRFDGTTHFLGGTGGYVTATNLFGGSAGQTGCGGGGAGWGIAGGGAIAGILGIAGGAGGKAIDTGGNVIITFSTSGKIYGTVS